MQRMQLVLKRGPEREAALETLMAQQQDKSSPNYHKWLTPDQFGSELALQIRISRPLPPGSNPTVSSR